MWFGKAAGCSDLMGTWIFAVTVVGTKEHFELKSFDFYRRLDTVILIYDNSLHGFLL